MCSKTQRQPPGRKQSCYPTLNRKREAYECALVQRRAALKEDINAIVETELRRIMEKREPPGLVRIDIDRGLGDLLF